MTDPRITQDASIAVAGGTLSHPRITQFAAIGVASEWADVQITQLALIVVAANGKEYQNLGPVIGLGCWSPCGVLAHRWNI